MVEKNMTTSSMSGDAADPATTGSSGVNGKKSETSVTRVRKKVYAGAFLTVLVVSFVLAMITRVSGTKLPPIAGIIPLLSLITVILTKSILVYKMWSAIQDSYARMGPGKAVGFLFIPFFNIYWAFRAFWGFAKDYNTFVGRYSLSVPKLPAGLFLAYCILSVLLFLVPQGMPVREMKLGVMLLLLIVWSVVSLVMIIKSCDAINALPAMDMKKMKEKIAVPPPPQVSPEKASEAGTEEAEIAETEGPAAKKRPDMKKELRTWGFGLMVLGSVHLFVKFLDPAWGVVIIVIGLLNLLVPKRGMFIVNGLALLFVGIMNIAAAKEAGQGGWAVFGILQIIWGVQEIRKFRRYAKPEGLEKEQEPAS